MQQIGLVLLGLAGCRGFDSPWEETRALEQTVSGFVRTTIDHPLPGTGWFRVDDLEATDFGQATLREVRGAKDDVVVLQMGSVGDDGAVLEFDIALGAWVAGALPVDGVASIGQIRAPGFRPFVVGGILDVRAAGVRRGELVEVAFEALSLAERAP